LAVWCCASVEWESYLYSVKSKKYCWLHMV